MFCKLLAINEIPPPDKSRRGIIYPYRKMHRIISLYVAMQI